VPPLLPLDTEVDDDASPHPPCARRRRHGIRGERRLLRGPDRVTVRATDGTLDTVPAADIEMTTLLPGDMVVLSPSGDAAPAVAG
jgi:hypothetical protein